MSSSTEPAGENKKVTSNSTQLISASDIERFGYCPLNFWLKYKGGKEKGKELEKGIESHEIIAKDIGTITERETTAIRSQIGILWFAIVAILLGINGAVIIYFKYISQIEEMTVSMVLLIISILWIALAITLFLIALYRDILSARNRAKTEVPVPADASSTKAAGSRSKHAAGPAQSEKALAPGTTVQQIQQSEHAVAKGPRLRGRTLAQWFITVAIALALSGYMLEYPFAPREVLSRILITGALLWLIGTSIALFFALRIEERMKKIDKGEMQDQYMIISKKYSRSEMLMLLFAAGAAILGIAGFIVQYETALEPLDLFGRIFIVLSLVWMSAGFLFFYKSLWGGVKTLKISQEIMSDLAVSPKKAIDIRKHLEAIEKGKILSEEYSVLSMAVMAMILGINSILIRIEATDIFSHILEIVALIWLLGASFFLYDVLKHRQIANSLRAHYKLGKDTIEYTDTMDEGVKLLESKNHNIRGRPDYIIKQKGKIIPVEVKTGRIPKGPHFSHILQLAAYCLLVEENYQQRPPYGLIRYGKEKEFKIDYDNKLEQLIKEKALEIQECIDKGSAHRNHRRKNKCMYCSRRAGCPEKLT